MSSIYLTELEILNIRVKPNALTVLAFLLSNSRLSSLGLETARLESVRLYYISLLIENLVKNARAGITFSKLLFLSQDINPQTGSGF